MIPILRSDVIHRAFWVYVLALLIASNLTAAKSQHIEVFEADGFLTWSAPLGATNTVEWAPSPEGPWSEDWSALQGLITEVGYHRVPTPRYFRIRCDVDPNYGLVAHYPLDGDTLDASGNGHHGAALGVAYTQGVKGGAYAFNGASSHIRIPHHPDFFGEAFTAITWLRAETASGVRGTISQARNQTPDQFRILLLPDRTIHFSFRANGDQSGSIGTPFIDYLGTWTMVSVVYSGTTNALYINDQLIGEVPFLGGPLQSDRDILIGAGAFDVDGDTPMQYWDGAIDEVRVYKRGLTPKEISALYDADKPGGGR